MHRMASVRVAFARGSSSDDGSDDHAQGLDDSEQGVPASSSATFPSYPAAATNDAPRRRADRPWLRFMAPLVGLVLLAGGGLVAFLLGSSSAPSATKMKVRRIVPFLDKQWRYIQTCPRVVTVEDFGGVGNGDNVAKGEPIQLVYDGTPSITLFGDSITELSFDAEMMGWGSLLANMYVRYGDVRNRGFSGYTTRDSVRALDMVFPPQGRSLARALPPAFVLVFLGTNDAVAPGAWVKDNGEDHHVPLDEYASNLKKIVGHLRAVNKEQRILLVTPPPVDDARQAPGRTNGRTRQYAEGMLALGKEEGIPTVDLWTACEGPKPEAIPGYLIDGLHLNAKGNRAAFEGVMQAIQAHFPELMPGREEMPKRVPDPW